MRLFLALFEEDDSYHNAGQNDQQAAA